MTHERRLVLLGLLLASLVGASAGIVSSVATSRSIDAYSARLLNDQQFVSLAPSKGVKYPGTYEDAIKALSDKTLRSLAVLLPSSADALTPAGLLFPKATDGRGVVVSEDGWVLFTSATFPKETNTKAVDVWVDQKRYAIDHVVRDTGSTLVLVKLVGASGLPAVSFASSGDEASGNMLFAGFGEDSLEPVVLDAADQTTQNGVLPAEVFATGWRLEKALPTGTPLFSSAGGLDGFALTNGDAFPLHHSEGFVQDVVRTGAVREAFLGAYVLDLSRAYNIDPSLKVQRAEGALLFSPVAQKPAVIPTGPAGKSGLKSGDIIVDVDGEAVTYSRTLAEILAEYDPGEIANIRIFRSGETSVVPVTLGDAAVSSY